MGLALSYDLTKGRRDLIAGLTVAAISLPQSVAYALIAGVDPRFGLYAAIVVATVAAIFGSSSHLINGPTSAISLLVFSSLAFLDPENHLAVQEALFLLAAMAGAIQILIAIFKLGDLTRYISESVIIGFLVAACFQLGVGQIPNALGLHNKGNAHMEFLHSLWLTLLYGDHINWRAVTLSVTAIVLAIALRKIVRKYRLPQIDMLLVLVITSLIAYFAGWSIPHLGGHTAVAVAAKVPASLPTFHIPVLDPAWLPNLSEGALAIAFIGLIEALSIAKAIANQSKQKLDYNRQILAEGLGNLAGGFFQCLPSSGSLTRSAVNFQAGAATRFTGIIAAATITIALLLFAPLLHYIPTPALAGILLVIAVRLVDFERLRYTLRASNYDTLLVIVTAGVGIIFSLDTAVLTGVALSILLFVPRAAKLKGSELLVTPERVVRERLPSDTVDPSIIIYDLEGEFFFGAAPDLDRYLETLKDRIETQGSQFLVLRLKRVRNPDVVCIERLEHFLREESARGVTVLLAGIRADTLRGLKKVGLEAWFPVSQIFPEEDREYSATLKAVRYAYAKRDEGGSRQSASPDQINKINAEKLYYLV